MGKKKKRRINISPATMLRPRMDNLWADEALLHKESDAIEGDLDVLARDVSPELFVKTMLRAYQAASEAARAKLDEIVPHWLAQSGYADTLKQMATEYELGPDLRPQALAWLETSGMDTNSLEHQPNLFMKARYYDDGVRFGEPAQAFVSVFWYTDQRRKRAYGLTFLLDYNPPWDGSVKDVIVVPRRPPRRLLREFQETWEQGGMEPETISPERAKTVILEALECNREAEIRLPRDIIRARDRFDHQVLALPDGPDTPAFTMEDFDFLAHHGERPEDLRHVEQTVGRRVRIGDEEFTVVDLRDGENEDWL
jgi:hypothetical protein